LTGLSEDGAGVFDADEVCERITGDALASNSKNPINEQRRLQRFMAEPA
jgi:hypothetical protein